MSRNKYAGYSMVRGKRVTSREGCVSRNISAAIQLIGAIMSHPARDV